MLPPTLRRRSAKYTSKLVFSEEAKLPILRLPRHFVATSAGTRLPAGFSPESVVSPRGRSTSTGVGSRQTASPPAAGATWKKAKKSMKIEAAFQRPPGSHFGRLWAPNKRFRVENGLKIDPKWVQNGSKKDPRQGV